MMLRLFCISYSFNMKITSAGFGEIHVLFTDPSMDRNEENGTSPDRYLGGG